VLDVASDSPDSFSARHRTGRNDIDPDPVGSPFDRAGTAERIDACFGRNDVRLQGHAAVLDRRADVHHAAAVITQPKIVRRFGYVECSEEVDVDHRFESVRAEVADRDGKFPAALLITTSSRPKVCNTCSITAVTSSCRRTSQTP